MSDRNVMALLQAPGGEQALGAFLKNGIYAFFKEVDFVASAAAGLPPIGPRRQEIPKFLEFELRRALGPCVDEFLGRSLRTTVKRSLGPWLAQKEHRRPLFAN